MNELEIAKKITGYLDLGASELKAGTAYRLQLARENALAALAEPQPVTAQTQVFALAGGPAGLPETSGAKRRMADARIWIGVLLILAGILCFQYWQSVQQVKDIEETDAAILTSDLPIEAYLDRGFQNWLKQPEP
jgi:hypothetical protein